MNKFALWIPALFIPLLLSLCVFGSDFDWPVRDWLPDVTKQSLTLVSSLVLLLVLVVWSYRPKYWFLPSYAGAVALGYSLYWFTSFTTELKPFVVGISWLTSASVYVGGLITIGVNPGRATGSAVILLAVAAVTGTLPTVVEQSADWSAGWGELHWASAASAWALACLVAAFGAVKWGAEAEHFSCRWLLGPGAFLAFLFLGFEAITKHDPASSAIEVLVLLPTVFAMMLITLCEALGDAHEDLNALELKHAQTEVLEEERDRQKLEYDRLLSFLEKTQHIYFKDQLNGKCLETHGAEQLGIRPESITRRGQMFERPQEYKAVQKQLKKEGKVPAKIVSLKQDKSLARSHQIRMIRDPHDKKAALGIVDDVTDLETLVKARLSFSEKCERDIAALHSKPLLEFVRSICDMACKFYCDAAIYVTGARSADGRLVRLHGQARDSTQPIARWPETLEPGLRTDEFENLSWKTSPETYEHLSVDEKHGILCSPFTIPLSLPGAEGTEDCDGVLFLVSEVLPEESKIEQVRTFHDALVRSMDGLGMTILQERGRSIQALWTAFRPGVSLRQLAVKALETVLGMSDFDMVIAAFNPGILPPVRAGDPSGDELVVSGLGQMTASVEAWVRKAYLSGPAPPNYGGQLSPQAYLARAIQTPDGQIGRLVVVKVARQDGDIEHFTRIEEGYLESIVMYFGMFFGRARTEYNFQQVYNGVQHDLATPVTHVLAAARVLSEADFAGMDNSEKLKKRVGDLLANGRLLRVLVSNLDPMRDQIEYRATNTYVFRDVVKKALVELGPKFVAAKSPAPRSTSADFTVIPPIKIARDALDRVVTNILVNTLKYGKDRDENTPPRVFAQEDDDWYRIVFQDWGMGIGDKEARSVFQEGYRGEDAHKRAVGGSGMGLWIAKDLAERVLGGELVLSHLSKPTEFTLSLPRNGFEPPRGAKE